MQHTATRIGSYGPPIETREGDGELILVGPRGSMALVDLGRGAFLFEYQGIAYEAFCEQSVAVLEDALERYGELTLFADASRMRSYETALRRTWTRWLQARRDSLRGCVVAASSPTVRMWIDVVNVATGGLVYGIGDPALLWRLIEETLSENDDRAAPTEERIVPASVIVERPNASQRRRYVSS